MTLLLSDVDLLHISRALKLLVLSMSDAADLESNPDLRRAQLSNAARALVLQGEFALMSSAVASARLVPVEDNPPEIEGES